jgi:membrane-associated protein
MPYRRFLVFNVVGALIWVALLLYAGYFFGNLPAVKRHLSVVIFGIIGVSLLPIVVSTWRARRRGA